MPNSREYRQELTAMSADLANLVGRAVQLSTGEHRKLDTQELLLITQHAEVIRDVLVNSMIPRHAEKLAPEYTEEPRNPSWVERCDANQLKSFDRTKPNYVGDEATPLLDAITHAKKKGQVM